MPAQKIEVYLSGGAANTDVNASLGGVVSTTKLTGSTISYSSTSIAGITLVDAAGISRNGDIGTITHLSVGGVIYYMKPGDTVPDVEYRLDTGGVDGRYILVNGDETATVTIDVVHASLGADQSDIAIEQIFNTPELFANVYESEATAGSSKYRHVYLKNIDNSTITIKVYIANNYTGLDILSIGFYTVTSGNTDELLSNEDQAPSLVDFNIPRNINDAIELTIASTQYIGMYLKREISALSDISTNPSVASIFIELA